MALDRFPVGRAPAPGTGGNGKDADDVASNGESPGDLANSRIIRRRSVLRSAIALRSPRGSKRRVTNRLNSVLHQVTKELRLLKMWMEFHLVHHRFDPRIAEQVWSWSKEGESLAAIGSKLVTTQR